MGLFWGVVTPLDDREPTGRCVTGFVLPFDQALGTADGLLHDPKSVMEFNAGYCPKWTMTEARGRNFGQVMAT